MPAGNRMSGFLTPGDGAPFHVVNADGSADCLLVCDHASRRIPERLGDLGLDRQHLGEHIAWDIGAEVMTRRLAERLDARAILAGFSRLVVDCNRYLDHPQAFVEVSDQIAVPGNQSLTDNAKAERAAALHQPYHAAIARHIDESLAAGRTPSLIAVHTMTDRMRGGELRPQEVTVCWARDGRLALPFMASLEARQDVHVGDNDPYGLDLGEDYTVPEQAMRHGLPHLQLEVRQDLVDDEAKAERWADILFDAMAAPLKAPSASTIEHHWPLAGEG